MDSREAVDHLAPLGLDAVSHRALGRLPLAYVAWADGTIDRVHRERIEELARTRFHLGPAGMAVLQGWLKTPPSRADVTATGFLELNPESRE